MPGTFIAPPEPNFCRNEVLNGKTPNYCVVGWHSTNVTCFVCLMVVNTWVVKRAVRAVFVLIKLLASKFNENSNGVFGQFQQEWWPTFGGNPRARWNSHGRCDGSKMDSACDGAEAPLHSGRFGSRYRPERYPRIRGNVSAGSP